MHWTSILDNLWNIDFGTKSLIDTLLRHYYVNNFHSTPLTPSFSVKMQIRIGSWVSLFLLRGRVVFRMRPQKPKPCAKTAMTR